MTTNIVSAEDPRVQEYVNANAKPFKMKKVLARLATADEIGKQHVTYVPDPDGNIIVEGTNTYAEGKVVVRFPVSIGELNGEVVYNEWLVKEPDFIKKYGGVLPTTTQWDYFQKTSNDNFALIDSTLMELFGAAPDDTKVKVAVSWANDGSMWAIKGGFATGYHVIAPAMADIMYEPVSGS